MERTTSSIYDSALVALAAGNLAACIPVRVGDETGVWMAEGPMPMPSEDDDLACLVMAYVACKRARLAAESQGLHPVD